MLTIRPITENEAQAVLLLWQKACIDAVGHELDEQSAKRVLANIRQYATHKHCHCLAALMDNEMVGFITFYLSDHPIQPSYLGRIEELYVEPSESRQSISKDLVSHATIYLKKAGAGVITTYVDASEAEQISFWHSLNWSQDTINFTIYHNVPADKDLQAVWDSYKPS